jgi:DNA-binding MarR family transcriptional regulator
MSATPATDREDMTVKRRNYNQRQLCAAIRAFRGVHARMEMQTAYIFLLTATMDEATQVRVAERAEVSQAGVSRNLLLLVELGLLTRRSGEIEEDLRRVTYSVTPKGHAVLRGIELDLIQTAHAGA